MAYEPVEPSPEHHTVDVEGVPVHYIDHGGSGPILVLVHGLGGAAINWMSSAPLLAVRTRVVALDLPGFGRTPRSGRPTTVEANAELLAAFVSRMFAGPVVLVGNSMGGMISMIAAAEHPDRVAGAVLVDPALPAWPDAIDPFVGQMFLAYHTPGLGEVFMTQWADTLGPRGMVEQMLQLCFADPTRISPAVVDAHLAQLMEAQADRDREIADFLEASRSLTGLLMDLDRWRGMVERIQAPVLLVAGDRDRLVPVVSARAMAELHPQWAYRELEDVGHTPMLEDPVGFTSAVFDWLDGAGKDAVHAAEHEEVLGPIA